MARQSVAAPTALATSIILTALLRITAGSALTTTISFLFPIISLSMLDKPLGVS
jgi:hypothetical protein